MPFVLTRKPYWYFERRWPRRFLTASLSNQGISISVSPKYRTRDAIPGSLVLGANIHAPMLISCPFCDAGTLSHIYINLTLFPPSRLRYHCLAPHLPRLSAMRATRVPAVSQDQDTSSPKTLTPQRKHRKLLKDGSSEVWPEDVERIFVQGLSSPLPFSIT